MKFLENKQIIFETIINIFEAKAKTAEQKVNTKKVDSDATKKEETANKAEQLAKTQNKPIEIPKSSESQKTVSDNSDNDITAVIAFKNNSHIISEILWRFLSPTRREKLDNLFYDAIKKNSLYVADLNTKDEDFANMLEKAELGKNIKKSLEQEPKTQPEEKTAPNIIKKPTQAEFKNAVQQQKKPINASYNTGEFEQIVTEAILGDLAKSALGLKPQKVKEIQLNAKTIYNNCVLILTIETYLANVMKLFTKTNGIKIEGSRYSDEVQFDEDNPDSREDLIKAFATKYTTDTNKIKSVIDKLNYKNSIKKRGENITQAERQRISEIDNWIQNDFRKKFTDDKAYKQFISDLKKNDLLTESVEQNQEIITEFITAISNFFKQKFKVINLKDMNAAQLTNYCNYLFTNKQFFIEQTKMLNKYLGTYQSYGTKFYQILADFNALEPDTKNKLISETFKDTSNFDNLFPVIEKVTKVLALTITRDMKKEIDKIMPASYKAGVKTGEFLGRLVSGHSNTKPINSSDSGAEG